MENTNKITEKQLETIVNQQKDMSALLSNIGLLESQKHGFLHQIAEVNKRVEEFKSELQAKYFLHRVQIHGLRLKCFTLMWDCRVYLVLRMTLQ